MALRDNNPRVRAEAINLASLLGPVACAPERAGNADERVRRIGNALIDNINSREALLRRAAMQALGQLRYPNAVQALSDQLSYHQKGPDAMAALEGLAGIGHPTSVSVFEELLTSSNADMRRLAVEGLARAGNREALPTMQQMGQSERSTACCSRSTTRTSSSARLTRSLQQLVASLGNPLSASARARISARPLDVSAPRLAESLKDQSADVRRLIADVLGFSRNTAVFPRSRRRRQDADPDVAAAALQAIERLKL